MGKPKFRFGTKSLLITTVVVAGLLYVVVYTQQWNDESKAILQEYNRVRGADGPTIATRDFHGRTYAIANVPCRLTTDPANPVIRDEVTQEDILRRNSGEIWITPPGEWVTEPSRAIYLLVNNL